PGLYGIRHVYTLQVAGGTPFFVLNGVGCRECDGEYGLYVLRLGQRIKWLSPPPGFAYPGRHLEMMEDSANAYRRQFFGHCLPNDSSAAVQFAHEQAEEDRKSTRLNSSHVSISYAVFCLKKKRTRI